MDPYSTLEVPHDATIQDIKKAYRRLAKLWHPDKNGGSLDTADMFRKVKAAYDCLVDPIKRAAADAQHKYQEQAAAAKRVKTEAERQARARAAAPPPSGRSGISPLATVLILIALVLFIAALFGSKEPVSRPAAA